MTLATSKIAFAIVFDYHVSISCSFHVNMGQLTSAKPEPYSSSLSVDFSLISLISGAYPFSNPSSLWSHERRVSTYAKISSWLGCAIEQLRTVSSEENRISRKPLCLPMIILSVLLSDVKRGPIGDDD